MVRVSADFLRHSTLLVPDTDYGEKDKCADVAPVEGIDVCVGSGFKLVNNCELVVVVSEINRRSSYQKVRTDN